MERTFGTTAFLCVVCLLMSLHHNGLRSIYLKDGRTKWTKLYKVFENLDDGNRATYPNKDSFRHGCKALVDCLMNRRVPEFLGKVMSDETVQAWNSLQSIVDRPLDAWVIQPTHEQPSANRVRTPDPERRPNPAPNNQEIPNNPPPNNPPPNNPPPNNPPPNNPAPNNQEIRQEQQSSSRERTQRVNETENKPNEKKKRTNQQSFEELNGSDLRLLEQQLDFERGTDLIPRITERNTTQRAAVQPPNQVQHEERPSMARDDRQTGTHQIAPNLSTNTNQGPTQPRDAPEGLRQINRRSVSIEGNGIGENERPIDRYQQVSTNNNMFLSGNFHFHGQVNFNSNSIEHTTINGHKKKEGSGKNQK